MQQARNASTLNFSDDRCRLVVADAREHQLVRPKRRSLACFSKTDPATLSQFTGLLSKGAARLEERELAGRSDRSHFVEQHCSDRSCG